MISLITHMWNLIKKINKQSRNRLIDTENRLAAVVGGGEIEDWFMK